MFSFLEDDNGELREASLYVILRSESVKLFILVDHFVAVDLINHLQVPRSVYVLTSFCNTH